MVKGADLPSKPEHYTLARFRRFCSVLRIELEPFQAQMLRDHFAGARELVIIIPKKNGKTTILAALALFHLLCYRDVAQVLIVAASRDQARILFTQAAELIRKAGLDYVFTVKAGYGYIWLAGGNSAGPKIAVRPAEAATGDGVIPTLALVDELHRHRSLELYGVLRDGLLGDARMITISTAGAGKSNPLWTVRENALKLPTKRSGVHVTARAPNRSFVLHEWALSDEDDLSNLRLVKRANPASWHTLEALAFRLNSPTMTPQQWARFACGVWTFGERAWITATEWDRLAVDIGRITQDDEVTLHVSAGPGGAAVALSAARQDEAAQASARVLPGAVPLEAVERLIAELAETYRVREVGFDRREFQRSAELLEARGLPMVERAHSPLGLSVASLTLHRLVQAGKLHHDGDPLLRSAVLQGTTKETETGWRFVPTPQTRALIALAFAVHSATSVPPELPSYVAL